MAHDGAEALRVEDVSVAFGGLLALDSVSVRVVRGEVVGVIGPNGAGKTTLFNVVSGFVTPDDGRIVIGGRSTRRLRPHQLAKLGVGRTLQGIGLWAQLTVLENVMAGAAGVEPGRAGRGAARDVAVVSRRARPRRSGDERARRPRGRRRRGPAPPTLPYATQKRVALARTLVAAPSLLLLDEPASGLSEAELSSLGTLLGELKDRMAVVLVEHHMDLVMSVCDRVVVLDVGSRSSRPAPPTR